MQKSEPDKKKSPIVNCLKQFNVCPYGIVETEYNMLIRLYNSTDGYRRIRTPDEYFDLPNIWVDACDIIALELDLCHKSKVGING